MMMMTMTITVQYNTGNEKWLTPTGAQGYNGLNYSELRFSTISTGYLD
jgi:hypothetical protein